MTERPTDPETRTASFGAGETLAQPRTGVFEVGEKPGDMVGPFKLLSVLGEGGFGIVWLAERREPIVQRVAVKVIKPGMDTREVVARFEQERQALAVMNHPNIAKVLDAGTTANGRPYFVMEYVKGDPITVYCDKNRLTLKQPCIGDMNNDGVVDDSDFTRFVSAYNILGCAQPEMPAGCPADFNNDGVVDDGDFVLFVPAYNALICP